MQTILTFLAVLSFTVWALSAPVVGAQQDRLHMDEHVKIAVIPAKAAPCACDCPKP